MSEAVQLSRSSPAFCGAITGNSGDGRHKKSFAYIQQSHPLPTCGRYGRRRDRSMSKLNGCAQFSDHPPCPSLSQQVADRRCFTLSALESTASDHEMCPRLCSSRAREISITFQERRREQHHQHGKREDESSTTQRRRRRKAAPNTFVSGNMEDPRKRS